MNEVIRYQKKKDIKVKKEKKKKEEENKFGNKK